MKLCYPTLNFVFQAEDGIRDGHVTGVQTCALPICGDPSLDGALGVTQRTVQRWIATGDRQRQRRSAERRVGKEWRPDWKPLNVNSELVCKTWEQQEIHPQVQR